MNLDPAQTCPLGLSNLVKKLVPDLPNIYNMQTLRCNTLMRFLSNTLTSILIGGRDVPKSIFIGRVSGDVVNSCRASSNTVLVCRAPSKVIICSRSTPLVSTFAREI